MAVELAPLAAPSQSDVQLAKESSRSLSRIVSSEHPLRFMAVDDQQEMIEIPASAAQLLVRLLAGMAQGRSVMLTPTHAELTTQQVADFLGVSRPFVVKEIESDRLPARKVGKHRRVRFEDLLEYAREMKASQQRSLDELTKLSEELGLD